MDEKIIVGVSQFDPLVINLDNSHSGFEIELWEIIAKKLKINFSYKSLEFPDLLPSIKRGEVDLAIAGISRTKKRENDVSFSYFTLRSGLSILISKKSKPSLLKTLKNFISENYKKSVKFLVIFFSFIFLIANALWFYERGIKEISEGYKEGIIDSIWWTISAVSGLGGFYPTTNEAKLIGLFVIFFGVAFFAVFVAKITSLVALDNVKYKINKPEDLKNKSVATRSGTTAVDALKMLGAKIIEEDEIESAFEKLKKGKIDAVVFDEPVIKNFVKKEQDDNLVITGETFDKQTYGFAFPHNSKIRESVNKELLGLFESKEYDLLYKKWFDN